MTLHITNGESTLTTLRETGIDGDMISWDDVLHEGPVPAGLTLAQMSDVRDRFLADAGWGSYDHVRARFAERDDALLRLSDNDRVVLWFEHDLYDQLQLIQLLDWFAAPERGNLNVELINVGTFPSRPDFHGLGELNTPELGSLYEIRRPVIDADLRLARAAWAAFTAPTPTGIVDLIGGDTSALPFLGAALVRHLEQFPALSNGLSRTERQILDTIAGGARKPVEVFLASQALEAAPFMGDTTFFEYLAKLARGRHPLLTTGNDHVPSPLSPEFVKESFGMTEQGWDVLAGRADHVRLNGIDRWLGGVHLHGDEAAWRWDARRLVGHGG